MIRVFLLTIGVLATVWFLPIESTQPSAFADPAFARYYRRSNSDQQTLLWGAGPLISVVEPYAGASGNRRLVQYFDRGRMELEAGSGSDGGDSITQGLLVRELVTGNVQIGDDTFTREDPADIPLFGSMTSSSPPAVTYADFSDIVEDPAPDRTELDNNRFEDWIGPGGTVSQASPPAIVRPARYDSSTGHNIPDVTVQWLDTQPFGQFPALEALGRPISEPYWTHSDKGSTGVSLVQLFERRIVVYTPGLPETEQFSLTSVGRHYYRWRYGSDPVPSKLNSQRAIVPEAIDTAGLTLPDGYQASVVRREMSDAFEIAVTPNGLIAVGHSDGHVSLVDPSKNNEPSQNLVENLANPRAMTYAGPDLYVVDDEGLHRFTDRDVDGRVDNRRGVINRAFDADSVATVAGEKGTLYVSGAPAGDGAIASGASGPGGLIRITAVETTDIQYIPGIEDVLGRLLLADDDGGLWFVDTAQQVIRVDPASNSREAVLNAGELDHIKDLLIYRPDGTNGDPEADMLALVTDAGDANGRIVRLRSGQSKSSAAAVPSPGRPSAIVDFASGFDRPSAMAAGLDGSLYVLDTGADILYRIQPD